MRVSCFNSHSSSLHSGWGGEGGRRNASFLLQLPLFIATLRVGRGEGENHNRKKLLLFVCFFFRFLLFFVFVFIVVIFLLRLIY